MTGAQVIMTAGHRSDTGGDARERARTPRFAHAYVDALYRAGHDVHYIQSMDEGDNRPDDFAGTLSAVARTVAAVAGRLTGSNLVMLDVHLETGNGAPGVFAIIPDDPTRAAGAGGDVWEENAAAIQVGRRIVERIAAYTGLPVRHATAPGLMSERLTDVGENKHRLAMFSHTAQHRHRMVRLVLEHGNLDKDLAIIDDTSTPGKCAQALVEVLQEIYGVPVKRMVPLGGAKSGPWSGTRAISRKSGGRGKHR